jgi:hypothetical protein
MACWLITTLLATHHTVVAGAGNKPLFDSADHYVMLILGSMTGFVNIIHHGAGSDIKQRQVLSTNTEQ